MRKEDQHLRQAARLVAAETARQGDHPSAEALVAYRADELDAEARSRVQDHVAACHICARILLDAAGQDRGVKDAEVDTAWAKLEARRRRVPAREDRRRGVGWPGASGGWLVAAALSGLVVGLAASWALFGGLRQGSEPELERSRSDTARAQLDLRQAEAERDASAQQLAAAEKRLAELQQQLDGVLQPQLSVPSLDLLPSGFLRGGGDLPVLRVSKEAPFFLLTLVPAEPVTGGGYQLQITDASGGKVWSGSELHPNPRGSFLVAMPRDALPSGELHLRLGPPGGSPDRLMSRYTFRLDLD